jgi:hypothetical protein
VPDGDAEALRAFGIALRHSLCPVLTVAHREHGRRGLRRL